MKLVGIVVNINGQYFVKDKDGNIRKLEVGDKIYEGEQVFGVNANDRIVLESPDTNDKLTLVGTQEYTASAFGNFVQVAPQALQENETQIQTQTQTHSTNSSTPEQDLAVGFQEIFLARDGKIVNVEAALIDTNTYAKDFDLREYNSKAQENRNPSFNPSPVLTTNLSEVQDNFYDTHLPSGTNTANNNFTFEALSGLKSLTIGTHSFTQNELASLSVSPVSITMNAGVLTLDGYTQNNGIYSISYTYKTSSPYHHAANSDLFVDTLTLKVTDIGGQTATGALSINVIDDKPLTEQDTNSIDEGRLIDTVNGNVFTNDYIGADDQTKIAPVVSVVSALDTGVDGSLNVGSLLQGAYGSLFLNLDGTYTYNLDELNDTVLSLGDDNTLIDTFFYTIEDGDKDSSTNKLLITINGTAAPIVVTQLGVVDDNFYDTYQASGTNEVNDYISISLGGDIKTVEIAGVVFRESELRELNTTPVTINMNAGVLTLNAYSQIGDESRISYNYSTSDNYLHNIDSDNFNDTVEIIVTDGADRVAIESLNINVIDDKPITQDDTNSLQEGQTINYVIGNVMLDNADFVGADDRTLPVVEIDGGSIGSFFLTQYGEILLKEDGSYKYILDNTNPTVRALVDGDTLHENFTYYIEDSDGDKASAQLQIEIEGSTSAPYLIALDGDVSEAALDTIGTTPSSNGEFYNGYVIGTANDGFSEITFSASDGSSLTITDLSTIDGTQTLDTPQGTLTLQSFLETQYAPGSAAKVGSIAYTYELKTPYDNPLISDSFEDKIDVVLTDIHNATGSDDLIITMQDDKPIANDDLNVITEDTALVTSVSGNVLSNDNDGADTNTTPITAQNIAGQYGQFVLGTDGVYIYTLDNDNPVVNALNTGETLIDSLTYTLTDSDGDSTTANLDITINGFSDPNLSVADVSVVEDGDNAGNFQVTFTITMDSTSLRDVTFDYVTVDGTAFDTKEYDYAAGTTTIAAGSTSTSVTVNLEADDYVADSGKTFDLKISNVNSAGAILDALGTATIIDDSQPLTPYDTSDTIEDSQESITLKLVATDSQGNILGTPLANSVIEGQEAYYKVVLVDSSDNPVFDKNGNPPTGTVNIIKTDGSAVADNSITGIGDYDGSSPSEIINVSVNTVFSIQTIDDAIQDSGEIFQVALLNDQSYLNASDYENVVHDTTAVETTINDGVVSIVTTLDLTGDGDVIEGASASYTLTLSEKPEHDFVVEITTTHIDTDNNDVIATTQDVTILAGQISSTFTVATLDDNVYEGNEDFKVSITNYPTTEFESLNIIHDNVVTTITDNETPPIVSIDDISVLEDGSAIFTVSLSSLAKNDVTFEFNTSDGSAVDGKDYTAVLGGSGTILAGDLTTTITVNLTDDYIADDLENFTVTLSNPSTNASISSTNATALATIYDDSNNTPYTLPDSVENNQESITLKLLALNNYDTLRGDTNEVGEGSSAYYMVVVVDSNGDLVRDANGALASGNVDIIINDGTAIGAINYENTLTNVEVNKPFAIKTIDDGINDDGKTFSVNIVANTSYSNASDYESVIHNTEAVTTTINQNGVPKTATFAQLVGDASVEEGNGAILAHSIEFRELDGTLVDLEVGNSVTINLSYGPDSTSADDFQTKTTQVVIYGDGGSSYDFTNLVADDFLNEGSESYTLSINSVVDTNIYFEDLQAGTDTVDGTIIDEVTPDVAKVSIVADQVITEGETSNNFTLSVDQPASDILNDILVNLTYSGVAQDGADYIGLHQVTIPSGSNSVEFSIPTINDKLIEGSEDFTITIGSIVDTNFEAISPDSTAASVTNTIIDDVDANPENVTLKEGGSVVNTSNLLVNDELGVNAKVVGFQYIDEAGNPQNGTLGQLTDTQYGEITVNEDGSWSYRSDSQENHPDDGNTQSALLKDIISYTIEDDNKVVSTSTLTINVEDTIGTIVDGPASILNEDDLSQGSDTTKEPLLVSNVNLGIQESHDGVESVSFNINDVQSALGSLSSQGVQLTYTLSGVNNTILTANAGATEVFVVTLNLAGGGSSYDFELKAPLDHPQGFDSLDVVVPFEYKEIGTSEDTIQGNLTVNIIDDKPIAIGELDDKSVVEGDVTPLSGNVLSNDIQGADGACLLDFKYKDINGNTQEKYFSDMLDTYTVDTPTGLLTVNRDGSWSFTAHSYVDHDDTIEGDTYIGDGTDNDSTQGSFDYRLQDYDQDNSSYVTQVIHVIDGLDPSSSGVTNAVDEDDILVIGSDTTKEPVLVSGALVVTGGSDPIDTTFTTAGSNTLTSNGVSIAYILSDNAHTLTGKAGSVVVFEAKITGDATQNNPTYSFELKAPLDHPDAAAQNTLDLSLEYKALDIDGDSVTSSLVVTITDDIPSIGTPYNDGEVDESGLPYGSTTDISKTKTSGTLDVLTESDTYDTFFDIDTLNALDALNITAGNPPELISYTLLDGGHTLVATSSTKDIFSVSIIDSNSINAKYEFTLINSFHHEGDPFKTLSFNFTTKDFDGDTTQSSFDVKVIDDSGVATKDITLNEDGSVQFGLTADTILSTADIITPHGKVTFDSTTNLFTYTPDADYSSNDSFDITYTTSSGDTTTTVNALINPIADKPDFQVENTQVEVDEDQLIALGLKVPKVTDDYDQNDIVPNSHDVSGDNPERLSVITLSGMPAGSQLHVGTQMAVMDGNPITIYITDLDNNNDGTLDHLNGVSATYNLTTAEFESIYIRPPLNSGENFDVVAEVTSYEVDDNGDILAGVAGKTAQAIVSVDVHAKTDDGVAIDLGALNGDEDQWIRIDDAINITKTLDTDGSEQYELVFDGANLPVGTLYYEGTPTDMSDRTIGQDASGGFTITVSDIDNLPEIYLMTPVNDSSDINDLKVTVNVQDTDSDSSPSTDVVKSASDYINITVLPIANDVVVSSHGASGEEDTNVALNLAFTNSDQSSEKIASVTISDIPDGAILYDANGTIVLDNSSGGTNSVTINTPGSDTTAIEGYTIRPPAHSSSDIILQVSMELQDFDDDGSPNTDTQMTANMAVAIEVLAVTENDATNSADPSGVDITLNSDHFYTTYGSEDTYFNLNTADAGFALFANNEDDNLLNPYGSEETFVVFTNLRALDTNLNTVVLNDAYIKYNDGSQDIEIKFSANDEVKIPLSYLDTVEIKPPSNFAGTFEVDMFVRSQDFDEDTSLAATIENSHSSTLSINVNPVVDDNPNVSIRQSVGVEDDGRSSDGKITAATAVNGIELKASISSLDTDGSEKFRVFFDAIPEDAALYYKGHIIYADSANSFINDGIVVTDNGDATYKVQIDDYSSTIAPKIIPPHNSDEDITLKISSQTVDIATMSDGSVVEVVGPLSAEKDLSVSISGVADSVKFTQLKTFDITEDTTITSGNKFSVQEKFDGSGAYNLIVEEDSASSGIGASIALNDIYLFANSINSYDNLFTNQIETSPVLDNSVSSENVTLTISGLDPSFDVSGATLVSGIGSSRIWSTTLADFKAGSVSVITPEHFSGEVDFDLKFISTEQTGNTKESAVEHLKVLVTPIAEDISTIGVDALEVNEDTLTHALVNFSVALRDTNGNQESIYAEWIKVADVTNKDFKIFYDDGTSQYNELASVVATNPDISIENIGGDDYYHLENQTFQNIYIQYDADLGPNPAVDSSINMKVSLIDYIDVGTQKIANVSTPVDIVYNMDLKAITDDIDAQVLSSTDISWSDNTDYDTPTPRDEITNISVDTNGDVSVDVMSNTALSIDIDIKGVDTAGEVDINNPTDTTNNPDYDGSEKIVRIRLDGVPQGIDIEDGYYAGDVGTPPVYSGIWYIQAPQDASGGDLSIDGVTTYTLQLNINGPVAYGQVGYDGHEVGGTIVVSFENQDGTASIENDNVTITLDDTNFEPYTTPEVPIDILEWNVDNSFEIVEDTEFTLNDIVDFVIKTDTVGDSGDGTYGGITGASTGDAITSNKFSLTVEGIENASVSGVGWNLDTTQGTPFYTYQGEGGQTEIDAALSALKILPNQDYNKNHDTAQGDSDTPSAFDEGSLDLRVVLTTYGAGGLMDTQGVDYSGNVTPVTDPFDLQAVLDFTDGTGGSVIEAQEDGKVAIGITLTSVDDPYLSIVGTDIIVKNISTPNSENEAMDGKLSYNDGTNIVTVDLKVGDSVSIPKDQINTVVFELEEYLAGDVKLEYSADIQEKDAAGSTTYTAEVDFHVNPVADGLDIVSGNIVGDEDTYIEITSENGDSFNTLGSLVDPTETLQSLVIDGVPNGYLVFYGDSHENSASVVGVSSGLVSFSIPISGGVPPKVWILAPQDVGGVSSTPTPNYDLLTSLSLQVGVDDMGTTVFNTKPINITINAVADAVSINPADSSGVEGSDIALNFNTTVVDTDRSESLLITLEGLHQDAVFKLDGVEIDTGYISYDKANDIYTIDNASIDYTNISKLTFMQNDFAGTVTTTVVAKEKSNFDTYATPASATFNVNITQQDGTSNDDTLLFDKDNGNDGLDGTDTLVFGYDWAQESIDFTLYDDTLTKNIEVLDLVPYGNHNLNLSTTDLAAMTDTNNTLTINADSRDSIALANSATDLDNVWAKVADTNVYESAKGGELTINGGIIGDALLNPTSGDDVLGYNDTKSIDGGDGNDRLIVFDSIEVDFTKVTNIEVIDLEVKGSHTISNLTLLEVISATDSNNSLSIFGDNTDNVDFEATDNWVKNDATNAYGGSTVSEGGKTFDVYTSANDTSVEVKVQVEINDAI